MNDDDIKKLAEEYREMEAPPYLETRIRAEVTKRPVRNHGWLPVATTAVMAAAVVGLLPMLWQGDSTPPATNSASAKPPSPSLSSLASIKVEKPAGVSPSLSRVRSLKAPRMPAKPSLPKPQEQTNSLIEIFEEKDHAHT